MQTRLDERFFENLTEYLQVSVADQVRVETTSWPKALLPKSDIIDNRYIGNKTNIDMHGAIMPVEIRHIRAFHAVAEALSFRRASEYLGVAQPALSRTIKDLEETLQVSLFERTTRITRLTEPGRVFLKCTSDLLADLDHAIDLAQRAHSGVAGELRVAFNDHVITGFLPQVVRRFRADYPDVEVTLIDSTTPQAVEMVLDERFDIAFVIGQQFQPEFDRIVVREEHVVCVLPTSHRLARRKRISVTALAEEPFIMGRWETWKSYNRLIRDFCGTHGFVPKIVQEAEHSDGILGLVAAAMGVTLQVDSPWIHALKGISVRPLRERPPEIQTSAIWRQDHRSTSPALDHFIQAIADVVSEESAEPS